MTVRRVGGDGTLFQGQRQQYTTSHGTRRLHQRSDYYLDGPNKDDAVLPHEKSDVFFVSSLLPASFLFSGIRSVDVTSLFAWHLVCDPGCTEGLLFFEFVRRQIFTCVITTAQRGKENTQDLGAK